MSDYLKNQFTSLKQHPKLNVTKTLNYGGPHIDRYEHTSIVGKRKVDMSFAQTV